MILQVVIQKIPENLQEFELIAAKERQPEYISAPCSCVRWHCLTEIKTQALPQ